MTGPPRRGDITLMQVAAPLHDTNGVVRGALALIINPDSEFSKILSVARSGDSGETYAFDQTGLLISRSRFDDQLHKVGLLAATNASSALYVRLHDPGGNLLAGYQPTDPDPATRPLVRMVADAVDGLDGVEVEPFRDYRGVPVVGAWRWLPHLGFGVATQIDADEAYRPLQVVRLLFVMLLLLLILCAVGMLLFSYANLRSLRRLGEAELKLKQLGQYTLEEKIGEGGMGVVYRAKHALMRRDTAVKLLLPDRADPETIQRFEREVCLTCQLTHPNTIQVYDYGHTPDGIFYYVMEFLRGLNLHEFTARFGPPPEARVIHILTQVCDSLAEAHGLGLIHRDIKPGNIFLCDRGGIPDCVKVLDFGLVQEYQAEKRRETNLAGRDELEGTPWFMPPEAITGANASDPRSDLYSVGALAYFLLTGTYAYDGATIREIHEHQLAGPPPPPSQRSTKPISAELDQLVLACLAADPADRPPSAVELRQSLLATPRAGEWTLVEQMAWWAQFHQQPLLPPVNTDGVSTPRATVRVDMNTRLQ
jgi:serine/threonine protein kinase